MWEEGIWGKKYITKRGDSGREKFKYSGITPHRRINFLAKLLKILIPKH